MNRQPASIEIRGLTKKYGNLLAIDHIDFDVYEGELFGFLGPNGAGKTTTINILTTLLKPTSGSAKVGGFDVVTEAEKVRNVIGLVPQEITVDDDLTGRENLVLQAALYHIPTLEARNRIEEVLELVGLSDAAGRKVEIYSGGMKKRLEIADGLIHRPRILFLDEPTLGLDVQTRTAIWDYIRWLRKEYNMTIFLTTHYMEEADSLCDRVAIIDHGQVKAIDTPSRLKDSLGGDIVEIMIQQPPPNIISQLQSVPLVKKVHGGSDSFKLTVERGEEALPRILEHVMSWGLRVTRVVLQRPTLDQVYLEYTGSSLREEHESWEDTFRQRMTRRRMRT
ncbi:MAG: ATP-binding cassette domain-containing protein [archaeon]|nr:ATP-binding cassette domain-containing protein [archaeon]